ncbi:MAG: hypothetical protein POELPBGB_03435 [Bacteroidia bacterium]|nr:hypothetical protein [Bacteroidia bacterium]
MKKILFTLAVAAFIFTSAFAQAPEKINYQGVANDVSGNPLATQNIGIRFSIHSGSPSGTVVYSETHNTTTDAQGVFSLIIGDGTVVSGTFSTINWGSNSFYLQNEMDPTGGTSYTDMGTTQLVSVPYALYAKEAANATTTSAINGTPFHVAVFDTTGHAVMGQFSTMMIDTVFHNVGLGTTTPNPSAILDIASTTKGVLFPRLTTGQINLIQVNNGNQGLLVYNVDTKSFWYWDGLAWVEM